jgi:peptide/nickel transport system substrate-binding protein
MKLDLTPGGPPVAKPENCRSAWPRFDRHGAYAASPEVWSLGELMRKSLRLVIAAGAALIAVTPLAAPKDSVTIGIPQEPTGLDPTTSAAAAIGEIAHYNIYEGLTKINEDFSVTPLLAESWIMSSDLKTLIFKLKSGIKFHDGESFSSKDVKFSFERAAAKDSTNKDKIFFASIDKIDTPDPQTVSLTFNEPSFEALFHLGMNTAVILDEKSAATDATNPIGTGPYKMTDWNKGSSVTLEKWDGYRDASKIEIARATFRIIDNPSAQVSALLAGDVDAFPRFSNSQAIDQFKNDSRFKVAIGGMEGKTIVAMNNKRKPLDDVRVRRAIAYAIDREAIINGALNGYGTPIGSHLTPNDPGYINLTGEYPHDPAMAKELLKEAGVRTPLSLSLILAPSADSRVGGQIVAAELADVGIQVKIENVEWAQWLSSVYKGHNYDLTIITHVEPLDIDIYANRDYYFGYDNKDFQEIIAKMNAAPDLATFRKYIGEAQKKIADDCVNAFLFQPQRITVTSANLQGLWKNSPIWVNDLSAMSWK